MDPHEQFWTEEFYRYSAECRRLARLAQKQPIAPESERTRVYRIYADWLSDVSQYVYPATPRLQVAASGRARR